MDKIYKRENYLNKIRGFYNDKIIKVITGIRRSGKSYLLKSIISELKEQGILDKDIIYIPLDKKEYLDVDNAIKLMNLIDSFISDKDFKYLFLDEVQNVDGINNVKIGFKIKTLLIITVFLICLFRIRVRINYWIHKFNII